MKRVTVSGQLALVLLIVALVGAWGWISNIIKLASMDFGGVTGMLVLRQGLSREKAQEQDKSRAARGGVVVK